MNRRVPRHRSLKPVQITDVVVAKEDVDERPDISCLFTQGGTHPGILPIEVVDDRTHGCAVRVHRRAFSHAVA